MANFLNVFSTIKNKFKKYKTINILKENMGEFLQSLKTWESFLWLKFGIPKMKYS